MSSSPPDPNSPKPATRHGVPSWLAGMIESLKPSEPGPGEDEVLPVWDAPGVAAVAPAPAAAEAAGAPGDGAVPAAEPVAAEVVAPAALPPCPICDAPRTAGQKLCDSCGYIFPPAGAPATALPVAEAVPVAGTVVRDRYELTGLLGERNGVERFRGVDHSTGAAVVVVRMPAAALVEAVPFEAVLAEPAEGEGYVEPPTDDEIMVGFDEPMPTSLPVTGPPESGPAFPSPAWEEKVLHAAGHPFLPQVLDSFADGGHEYLVEEVPAGRSLWDAWDDPDASAEQRFTWLRHVAEQVHALHLAGAMPESLRPDVIVVTPDGRGRLADLSDLLPLPLPAGVPVRGSLYTAPELVANSGRADARANLYSFGGMLYALHVGRELTEMDFERPGSPKAFIPRFPDTHPLFGRLMMKTFTREPGARFPSDEAAKEDASGFTELVRTLDVCARTLDNVHLEIAAWTTTGMVRTGNEDAFALLHATESRQDDVGECALVLLCDGMGGYDAGEVAAALAIQYLRKNLLAHKALAPLAGASAFPTEVPRAEGNAPALLGVDEAKKLLRAALKDTNRGIYQAARGGVGKRGMGCTAEAVYIDGRHVVVGHVGDSRTYHFHEGRLVQLTRDQTLVNRLVELGQLTPEEAEDHPRKNELQQAIGGQPDVEPGVYAGDLKPGDWVIVCSDGVTNHVKDHELAQMIGAQGEAASAEVAARRLVNLVNIEGATDNATIVVIRAT